MIETINCLDCYTFGTNYLSIVALFLLILLTIIYYDFVSKNIYK